jgi:hypothetical protein
MSAMDRLVLDLPTIEPGGVANVKACVEQLVRVAVGEVGVGGVDKRGAPPHRDS